MPNKYSDHCDACCCILTGWLWVTMTEDATILQFTATDDINVDSIADRHAATSLPVTWPVERAHVGRGHDRGGHAAAPTKDHQLCSELQSVQFFRHFFFWKIMVVFDADHSSSKLSCTTSSAPTMTSTVNSRVQSYLTSPYIHPLPNEVKNCFIYSIFLLLYTLAIYLSTKTILLYHKINTLSQNNNVLLYNTLRQSFDLAFPTSPKVHQFV